MCAYMYMYVYVYVCICVYVYICIRMPVVWCCVNTTEAALVHQKHFSYCNTELRMV